MHNDFINLDVSSITSNQNSSEDIHKKFTCIHELCKFLYEENSDNSTKLNEVWCHKCNFSYICACCESFVDSNINYHITDENKIKHDKKCISCKRIIKVHLCKKCVQLTTDCVCIKLKNYDIFRK